jgi:hypothetical protein
MTYSIEQLGGITRVQFTTSPSVDEINSAGTQVSKMQGTSKRLWTFEAGMDFSAKEVNLIAIRTKARKYPRSSVAIVTNHDLAYGLSRMYTVLSEIDGITVQVFSSEPEAIDWLHGQGSD